MHPLQIYRCPGVKLSTCWNPSTNHVKKWEYLYSSMIFYNRLRAVQWDSTLCTILEAPFCLDRDRQAKLGACKGKISTVKYLTKLCLGFIFLVQYDIMANSAQFVAWVESNVFYFSKGPCACMQSFHIYGTKYFSWHIYIFSIILFL